MANIITDLGSGEMAVRMTDARFARQPIPSVFTGWTTLRVALLIRLINNGVNLTGTPRFGFGLCAGGTNILGDATTDHFAGMLSTTATWTRNATFYGQFSVNPAKRVNTTITTGTALTPNTLIMTGTTSSLFFIDITKGSPDYSFQTFCRVNTTGTPALSDFLLQSVNAVPVFASHSYTAAQTLAVNEATDGTFDYSCVWWDQAATSMDILAWRVYRVT